MPLTDSQILERLNRHEDNFVERKPEGANKAEIREALCAFANSVREGETGLLFIGIANDGRLEGVSNPDKLQRTVREAAEQDCYPPIRFYSRVFPFEEKHVICVEVEASTERPHFTGPAFIRVGSETKRASAQIYAELIACRNEKARRILQEKGKLVSVQLPRPRGDGMFAKYARFSFLMPREYRVEDCDAHRVVLFRPDLSESEAHPLDRILVSEDVTRHRLLLIVSD